MTDDTPDDDDIDPTGHLAAMLDAAIHAKEHGGDPQGAHKIAALADEGDDEQPDTDLHDPSADY